MSSQHRATAIAWSIVAIGALVIARRAGGAADSHASPPSSKADGTGAHVTSPRARTNDASGSQIAIRLVEQLGDARVDSPSARAADPIFAAHVRKTHAPWASANGSSAPSGTKGEGARFATKIALSMTPDGAPIDHATPANAATPEWGPDPRKWPVNEGTFDEREAIYAPTPSTFAFKIAVPIGAKLTFAPGTINRATDAVVFAVTAIDARGASHDLFEKRVPPAIDRRWLDDESIDLARFAGTTIELRLRASIAPANADEKAASHKPKPWTPKPKTPATPSPAAAKRAANAAAERALTTPSPIALALWGTPSITTSGETDVPFDVVWIHADAIHPDVVDAATPTVDALAARGAKFNDAHASASWARPAIVAIFAGARASEVGVGASQWTLADGEADRFYGASPPLVPLILRAHGVATCAFASDPFVSSTTPVGLDLGFDRLVDSRDRAKDARAIADDAVAWLHAHAAARFFAYVSFASPDAAKVDDAIARIEGAIDAAQLRDRTLFVVTADPVGAVGRVPLVLAGPGITPRAIDARVRTIDVAPTLLDLESIDAADARAKMSGASLVPLLRGETEPDPRVVVIESRGARGLLFGTKHLVVPDREAARADGAEPDLPAADALFDLAADPDEHHDLAREHPDVVAEMRARLDAAITNAPAAGSAASLAPNDPRGAIVHLRFAGDGAVHRVAGRIVARAARIAIAGAGLADDVWKIDGSAADVAFTTAPRAIVGLDVRTDPPGAAIAWELTLDDAPWPVDRVYAGPFGLASPKLARGVTTDEARALAASAAAPWIDPSRDLGLFVTRDPSR